MTGKTKLVTRPILPMLGISASIVTCVFDKGKPKFCTLLRRGRVAAVGLVEISVQGKVHLAERLWNEIALC